MKYNIETVRAYIENLGGILISNEYKGAREGLELMCPDCKITFVRTFSNIAKRNRVTCKSCSLKSKWSELKYTYNDVKAYIENLGGTLLSQEHEYSDTKSKLKLSCPDCKQEFERTFDNVMTRKRVTCKSCSLIKSQETLKHSYEYVKNFIEIESESGCLLISEKYTSVDDKLDIKCACGDMFECSFYKFKDRNKRQCTKCGRKNAGKKIMVQEDVIIKFVSDSGYKYLGNNTEGKDQRILVQCEKNHNPYLVRWAKFKNGQRCPACNRSLGELEIAKVLDKFSVSYRREEKFEDLIGTGGGHLRYDFAIIDKNDVLALIEFDGIQHFEDSFGEDFSLEKIQTHDKMKNKYAEDNHIKLYRISYKQFDQISNIVEEILCDVGILSKCKI